MRSLTEFLLNIVLVFFILSFLVLGLDFFNKNQDKTISDKINVMKILEENKLLKEQNSQLIEKNKEDKNNSYNCESSILRLESKIENLKNKNIGQNNYVVDKSFEYKNIVLKKENALCKEDSNKKDKEIETYKNKIEFDKEQYRKLYEYSQLLKEAKCSLPLTQTKKVIEDKPKEIKKTKIINMVDQLN